MKRNWLPLLCIFLFCLNNKITAYCQIIPMQGGGSSVGNGGDWFVKKLPILKFELPEDFAVVEGVQYKKVGLRRCTVNEVEKLNDSTLVPDKYNFIFLPDRNWSVYKVILEDAKYLLCSVGLVDSNPATALNTLLNNSDTNRILYFEDAIENKNIKYSKSTGILGKNNFAIASIGSFISNFNSRGVFIGYNLQDGYRVLGAPRSIYFNQEANPVDFVYIPLSIQERNRNYLVQTVVDNSYSPVWRVILPIALHGADLPINDLAEALDKDKVSGYELGKAFRVIKFGTWADDTTTKFEAWTSMSETLTSLSLRKLIMKKYNVSQDAVMNCPDCLMPKLKIDFLPSILNGELNHAAFIHGQENSYIRIPIVSQQWRIGADIVHELAHALQDSCGNICSDEKIFILEMEAHTLERQHIKEMTEMYPATVFANKAFNYLVAASLPNVVWSSEYQTLEPDNLCHEVIMNYKLDILKISKTVLNKFNCTL